MSDSYQPTEAAPAPAPAAPPPAPASIPSSENFDTRELGQQYQGQHYEDGRPKIHTGGEAAARSAALELGRTRRERQEWQGGPTLDDSLGPEGELIEMKYVDGRPEDQPLDIKEGASNLAGARADIAAKLNQLAGVQQPTPEVQPEAQAQPQQFAEPVDERAAAVAQYGPQIQQNIAQLRASLAEQESAAQTLGLDVPPGPHHEALQQFNAGIQAAETARQNYEIALHAQLLGSQAEAAEFARIKTAEDVERFRHDPAAMQRYSNWAARHTQLQNELGQIRAQGAQLAQAHAAQFNQLQQQKFKEWADVQEKIIEQRIPELRQDANPQVRAAKQQQAFQTLKDVGYSQEEIAQAWQGPFLRDHRAQQLLWDAMSWREAKAKALTAQTRPVPQVQRPGVSNGGYVHREVVAQDLSRQLDNATSSQQQLRLAAQLLGARRAAAAR